MAQTSFQNTFSPDKASVKWQPKSYEEYRVIFPFVGYDFPYPVPLISKHSSDRVVERLHKVLAIQPPRIEDGLLYIGEVHAVISCSDFGERELFFWLTSVWSEKVVATLKNEPHPYAKITTTGAYASVF